MTAPSTTTLTIGQVADATGLSVHTLRLYEREGLFTGDIGRTADGRRAYTGADVEWLSTCMKFRASGMPLATIGRFAQLVREGSGNERARLALLRDHERRVRAHLAELEDCLALIVAKVTSYEAHLARGTATGLWGATVGDRDPSEPRPA